MLPYKIAFFQWLPTCMVIIGMSALIGISVQYSYRSNLNDPQIQMARDAAARLAAGAQPVEVVPPRGTPQVDIGASLAPYIAVYDSTGASLESSGILNGMPPEPPQGVFEYARMRGENRVTWQPERGTRIALVVVSAGNDRFVAAGRNMREVEMRECWLYTLVLIGMVLTMGLSLSVQLYGAYRKKMHPVGPPPGAASGGPQPPQQPH